MINPWETRYLIDISPMTDAIFVTLLVCMSATVFFVWINGFIKVCRGELGGCGFVGCPPPPSLPKVVL